MSRTANRWRLGLAGAMLAFGLYSEDWKSGVWAGLSLLCFGLPLALQWWPHGALRVYALWFGVFMALQSLLTPLLKGDHVALPPRMKTTVEVSALDIPGYAPGVRRVTTDERGWRVQPPLDYGRKTGPRIFAIGGSTTEDIALDDGATWTHRLQQALASEMSGLRVVNTGVSGLRAANHVATLRVVSSLQPDLAVVLLGANDWNKQIKDHFEIERKAWHPPPFRETALARTLDGLVLTPLRRLAGRPAWTDSTIGITRADELIGGRRRASNRTPVHAWVPIAVTPSYAAELERLGQRCREAALRCLFVTQPHAYGPPPAGERLRGLFWMTPPYATYGLDLASMAAIAKLYNGHLAAFAARGGHLMCDLAAAMGSDERHFYDEMHFTDEGAKRVAEVLADCVRRGLALGGPGTTPK